MRLTNLTAAVVVLLLNAACGPRAHIPPRPVLVPGALDAADSSAVLARALAPLLYLQKDESFPLERVVAVIHPTEPLIAYHLLWRDDVHGAWIPFTKPTDEEVVWVRYDSTRAPVEVWTYWHGKILRSAWQNRGQVEIDVQWGKHGSLPRGIVESDLPGTRKLNFFYAATIFGFWDILLSDLNRPGPLCFCRGYDRYRDYSRPLPLNDALDAVVVGPDPSPALRAVFGLRYSEKRVWPWLEW